MYKKKTSKSKILGKKKETYRAISSGSQLRSILAVGPSCGATMSDKIQNPVRHLKLTAQPEDEATSEVE